MLIAILLITCNKRPDHQSIKIQISPILDILDKVFQQHKLLPIFLSDLQLNGS